MTISLVGTATGTSSCTVPSHQAGDLILIFAFRGGATGAPSLPAGYVSVTTKNGTLSAARIGYKIATASNDTSGTWTSADQLTCHVYRQSVDWLTIGANAATNSTTNTVNYPALTLQKTDSTSWVAGFAGVSNTSETIATAPSGMTNETSVVGASYSVAGHDTEGGVASWSSTNVVTTGTAGNSVSATVEIMAADSFAIAGPRLLEM